VNGGDAIADRDPSRGFLHRHLDKLGAGGSLFTALCCLGFPAVVSLVSAMGLGFVLNDKILIPLLVGFLLLTLAGLALGMRHHRRPWALLLGVASAALTFGFIAIHTNQVLAGIGVAGLIGASVLNVWLQSRREHR
jgi:hypothetical protein